MKRRLALLAALAALVAGLCLPPAATAQEPPQLVAGANSKWISGSLLQQIGLNCSVAIIGNAYTEVMVSGIASYGGAPNGGVPRVGDPYWTAFLVSIPGNPCGSGSSAVTTTLILPPNTQVDSARQIKCYGLPRSGSGWQDLTGASWSFLGQSGPYCANQPSISPYHQGGLQIGFRPLANGQMFWIFVPVKSSAKLIGAAGPSPGHGFTWLTDATGVYANPGRSFVWANVFDAGLAADPFIFFSREPSAIPFWKDDAPDGQKNRVEFFADLFSDFEPGTLCFELYGGTSATGTPLLDCTDLGSSWNGTVTNQSDLWQVFGTGDSRGPNGGYVPFVYGENETYTMRWKFTHGSAGSPAIKDVTFTTLSGPDPDGDGVANNGPDSCPDVKGTQPNGCMPPPQGDDDGDGVFGAADKCPGQNGNGAVDGCPGIDPLKPPVLTGTLGIRKGALLGRAALAKGAPVKFTCTVDSSAVGTLNITRRIAKRLRIATKKKTIALAKGRGACKAASGGSLKLKVVRAYARKLRRARRLPGSVAVKLTAAGQTPVTMKRAVKFG